MLHLALTGNIASGKSTVSTMLARHGATIIDADQLAREAVAVGTPGLEAVVDRFGAGMLQADGSLDRAALRRVVFHDAAARDALNAIVHPTVGRLREEALAARGPVATGWSFPTSPCSSKLGSNTRSMGSSSWTLQRPCGSSASYRPGGCRGPTPRL